MNKEGLKKSINLIEAISIVVGVIIGSGIFLKPGIVLKNAGSPVMAMLAWICGGIITLASALTIAEIASSIPKTGGLYVYLEDLYGDVWGFLLGWVQSVIAYPGSCAALAIAFSGLLSFLIPMSSWQMKILALSLIIFLTTMNIISTKVGGVIQIFSTIGKLLPIAAIIIFAFIKGKFNCSIFISQGASEGFGFGAAILGTLWAYDGWIGVTNVAGELENPKKNLPKSIIIGVVSVIIVYALFNAAMFIVLPMDKIVSSSQPALDAAVALFGKRAGVYIIIGMIVSVFGALNGYLMTGGRVPFAMAERRQLPFYNILEKSHKRFKTPYTALILQAIISCIYIFTGSFNALSDLIIFVVWIFFVMGVAGIFILRRKMPSSEGYKVPLFPIVPLIGVSGGLYILISTLISNTLNSFIGICITLVGLPVYFYLKRIKENNRPV